MHPDRVIVLTYRQSDGISTRQDDQNTLTHQPSDINNDLRYPPSRTCYMESCPEMALLYAMATSMSIDTSTTPCISTAVTVTMSTALLHQETTKCLIIYLTLARHWHQNFCWSQFLTGL